MLFKKLQAKIGTRMYTMTDSQIWVECIIENRDAALYVAVAEKVKGQHYVLTTDLENWDYFHHFYSKHYISSIAGSVKIWPRKRL